MYPAAILDRRAARRDERSVANEARSQLPASYHGHFAQFLLSS
jgi:hypothetical protein